MPCAFHTDWAGFFVAGGHPAAAPRNVGCHYLNSPVGNAIAHLLERHRKRIWLLTGRSSCAPDADAPLRGPSRHQLRHDGLAELLEWNFCPGRKKIRVMASTTCVASASVSGRRSVCTNSATLVRPAARATGSSRLSARYCLSGARTSPERSRRKVRRYSKSSTLIGRPRKTDA